jgi:tetraacyldisaccharide 4'-kinase
VICVGNLTAGGAGKTPTVIAVLEALAGRTPHALSRGHGGRLRGPHRVDPLRDTAADVGDEPLLLAAFAPTWVARDRAAGAAAAVAAGAGAVVMDDGFQNPGLAKDLSLVVVDAAQGFGNGRLIPAGPLRERVADGLARADAVVLIGSDTDAGAAMARWPDLATRPVLRARLEPLATGLPLDGADVVAFAGIGRPEKLFATLRACGARLVAAHGFPDHAPYPVPILRRLVAEARAADAMLVTTEKDAVRLPPAFRREVIALPVRLRWADPAALDRLLGAL